MVTDHQNLDEISGFEDAGDILQANIENLEVGRQFYIPDTGENISDLDPVCVKEADDKYWKCDANDAALLDFRGLANGAITSGNDGHGYGFGAIVTEGTWTWDMDKMIFVDDSKALSQTVGTYGIIAGVPLAPTVMLVMPLTLKYLFATIADPAAQAALTASALTDNSGGGAADGTVDAITVSITDPSDSPADADALRDDLVATTIPSIEAALQTVADAIKELATMINKNTADGVAAKTATDANNTAAVAILARLEKVMINAES